MTTINPVMMGERIKKQRKLNGYSREKLAEMADITPRFCYDLELGLKNMSVNTLCRLYSVRFCCGQKQSKASDKPY